MYYYAYCRHNDDTCGHKHRSVIDASRCADKHNASIVKYNPGCYGTWEPRKSDDEPLNNWELNRIYPDMGYLVDDQS
jgi:hypothetical protein